MPGPVVCREKDARFVQERAAGPAVRFGHVRYHDLLLDGAAGTRGLPVSATVQGELWSSDPRGWAEAAEGRIRPLYERVLERLHPLPETRLLDAGCGSGLFAELAAQGGADVIGVGAGPEQAESAALIDRLAPHDEVPDRSTLDLADADSARGALLDAGFASVAMADIAFDVDFESEDDAVAAQLPAGPVAAAVRHSGRAAVEAALRSFFAPRSRTDGTVRMGVVFRCYLAERAR